MSEDLVVTNDSVVMNMPVTDDTGKQTELPASELETIVSNNRQGLDECLRINVRI